MRAQPINIPDPSGTPIPPSPVVYGEQYLRVVLDYLYLPSINRQHLTYSAKIKVNDQTAQSIDFLFEQQKYLFYSDIGRRVILPPVALNRRGPISIEQELRVLRRDSESLGFLRGIFNTLAPLVGGSAGAGLTTISNQGEGAQDAVAAYEQKTQVTDRNFWQWLDPEADLPSGVFAGFSKGHALSMKRATGGPELLIPEHMLTGKNFSRTTLYHDAPVLSWKVVPTYEVDLNSGIVPNPQRVLAPDIAYFTGKHAYAVLSLERVQLYPTISSNPEQVVATAEHFHQLDEILSQTTVTQETKRSLIDAEGKRLIATLTKLTDESKLTLKDAATLVQVFLNRAVADAALAYQPAMVQAMARRFSSPV
jgi:hypothetical protein